MRTEFFMYFCIKSCIGTQGEVGWLLKCFKPPQVVYSTDRSKAVVPELVLLFVALWLILRGDLFYVLPCVILFLQIFMYFCIKSNIVALPRLFSYLFSVHLALRLPRLGKIELILVLFVICSICACLVLSVFTSSWCLGRAAVCDCGIPWTFLLPFSLTGNCYVLLADILRIPIELSWVMEGILDLIGLALKN